MHSVNQAMGYIQLYRISGYPFQIAAPSIATRGLSRSTWTITLNTFHEDKPVGINRKDRISSPFCCQPPVNGFVSAAPAGLFMRLIVQICTDDHGIAFVVIGEHLPVGDPARLRISRGIPERRLRLRVWAM